MKDLGSPDTIDCLKVQNDTMQIQDLEQISALKITRYMVTAGIVEHVFKCYIILHMISTLTHYVPISEHLLPEIFVTTLL